MKTVRNVPELRRHETIITRLGCARMSLDESSVEHGMKVYRVKKKYWRASELGPFLCMIDRVTEQTKNATTTRGSTKYKRILGEKESQEGGIVSGLPINFYNPVWLADLRANKKPAYDSLNIKREAYTLAHDQVIQK